MINGIYLLLEMSPLSNVEQGVFAQVNTRTTCPECITALQRVPAKSPKHELAVCSYVVTNVDPHCKVKPAEVAHRNDMGNCLLSVHPSACPRGTGRPSIDRFSMKVDI
jgi:hypothetical protein